MNGDKSQINDVNIAMLSTMFRKVAADGTDNIEEGVGTLSTSSTVLQTRDDLILFLKDQKHSNCFFYIYTGSLDERNLVLVMNTVAERNEQTRDFAIVIANSWDKFDVRQTTVSSKVLTIVATYDQRAK
jgi:hypothetical protein